MANATVNLRRLGVYGANLPTKKSIAVVASDFLIGGIIGRFERKYDKAIEVNTPEQFQEVFGDHIISTYYGWDVVSGYFDNVVGVDAKLFVASHVGYTGSAIDAVIADADLDDQQTVPDQVLTIEAAYQTELEYGISGNRTGYTVTNGFRFETAAGAANLSTDTFVELDSVIGVKVGDIMQFVATGGGGATVYKKITQVDESTKRVTFGTAFDGAANMEIGDTAKVIGFQLKVWRKNINGIVTEVDEELGKIWCTTESEVTDFYVENVFATSKWIKVTRNSTTPADIEDTFPLAVATVTYLTGGDDGTAPTTAAHWDRTLDKFNAEPVRFITNAETSTKAIQEAGETYCKGRDDTPKWIFMVAEDQTKAQLITAGNGYQRTDDVLGVIVANWLQITDPFSTSALAPPRHVPNVGHVMGAWVRSIGQLGIHYVPAVKSITLKGIVGVVGEQFLDDTDRTDLAEAGINLIQELTGVGTVIRNFFTPSTSTEFLFANGILMRDYFKASIVDSLQISENTPNSIGRIREDKMAVLFFMQRLWSRGSTGNVPLGETFGQFETEQGEVTNFDDHVEVKADITNNPQSSINLGERNIDMWFTYPTPAGSIKIGVGILLRG